MNLTATHPAAAVNTSIHNTSNKFETPGVPSASALLTFTACVSGKNHASFETQAGIAESGKNIPEKKNIGDITRLK